MAVTQEALKGILGMMRFGDIESPILLESLGDLLVTQMPYVESAQRLAACAYLKASYHVDDEKAREAYRKNAEAILHTQHSVFIEDIEKDFESELAEAGEWYAKVRADELRWIAEGVNVDAKFSEKYFQEPLLSGKIGGWVWTPKKIAMGVLSGLLVVGCISVAVLVFLIKTFRIRLAQRAEHSKQ